MTHGPRERSESNQHGGNILDPSRDYARIDKQEVAASPLESRSCPERLKSVVCGLTDTQKKAVAEIGFGSLLEIGTGRLIKPLCAWLIDRFDPQTKTLQINGTGYVAFAAAFEQVMSIKDGGHPIVICGRSTDIADLKVLFKRENKGVPRSVIEELAVEAKDGGKTFR